MRARLIVIRRIGGKNSSQVRLATDNYMIKTLATQRTDQTFGNAILAWRSRRDRPVADAHRGDAIGREEASPVTPSSTGEGERGSRLQKPTTRLE